MIQFFKHLMNWGFLIYFDEVANKWLFYSLFWASYLLEVELILTSFGFDTNFSSFFSFLMCGSRFEHLLLNS